MAPSRTRRLAFDFGGKIDVAGRVDDVDRILAPVDGDGGGVDRNALGAFERVEVRGRVPAVHIAKLVLGAAEVEDALGGRRLTGVHVGDDADVSQFFKVLIVANSVFGPWERHAD